jgi:hypothetical protein
MCSDFVKVRIEDGAGVRDVTANVEDISPYGDCIQMPVRPIRLRK